MYLLIPIVPTQLLQLEVSHREQDLPRLRITAVETVIPGELELSPSHDFVGGGGVGAPVGVANRASGIKERL